LCCSVCFNFKEPTPARFRLLVISAGCSAGLSCRRQEVFTRTVFSCLTSCFPRCFSLEHCAFVQLCRPDLFLRVAVLGFVLWPGQLFLLLCTRGSSISAGDFSLQLVAGPPCLVLLTGASSAYREKPSPRPRAPRHQINFLRWFSLLVSCAPVRSAA
jgi:hypothetical protein